MQLCGHYNKKDDNMTSTLDMCQESLKIFLGDLDKMMKTNGLLLLSFYKEGSMS